MTLILLGLLCVCCLATLVMVAFSTFGRSRLDLASELSLARREAAESARDLRDELYSRLEALRGQLAVEAKSARQESAASFAEIRQAVEQQLTNLKTENSRKLEEMRHTVAEKLEGTLERRLGDSFKLVS